MQINSANSDLRTSFVQVDRYDTQPYVAEKNNTLRNRLMGAVASVVSGVGVAVIVYNEVMVKPSVTSWFQEEGSHLGLHPSNETTKYVVSTVFGVIPAVVGAIITARYTGTNPARVAMNSGQYGAINS